MCPRENPLDSLCGLKITLASARTSARTTSSTSAGTSPCTTARTTATEIRTTSIGTSGCSLGFNKRYTCHNGSTDYRQSRFGCLLEELTTRLEFLVLLWVRHKNLSFFCIGTPAIRVKNGENGCVHTRDNTRDIDIKKAWEFSWCRSHSWGSRIARYIKNDNAKPTPI